MPRRSRALVVGAASDRRRQVVETLERQGNKVEVFDDHEVAVGAHRAEPFHLAVVIVGAAGAAIAPCRAFSVRPSVRVLVVIVPSASQGEITAMLAAGAGDVLIDPCVAASLDIRLQVAQRKASERSLADSLLVALPDLVFCFSKDGTFTDFHAPGGHHLYAPAERIIGGNVLDLLPPAVASGTMETMKRALATRSLAVFEYSLSFEGRDEDFEARMVPRGDDEVLAVVRNVTSDRKAQEATRTVAAMEERVRDQEKLLQVQKAESLGLLAGGIAHDFNNLLTAIMGHASVALLKLPESSVARPSIDALVSAARRAADLTQQLLAYSGKGRFQIRMIDLSEHIREIVTLLEAATPKQVQLRLELAADLPAVECDIAQIQQVVMNLVINATEAIGEKRGTVLVVTGRQTIDATYPAEPLSGEAPKPGDYVFVEVQDDGSGMDDTTRARLFDPFFTTKSAGRGLGLAAVLGIVRAHHGIIRIYSAPGHGTTFKVLFPAQGAPAEHREAARAMSTRGSGLVLVVDDEQFLRHAARAILEHFGFSVIEAGGGEEALTRYREAPEKVAAVLLDMTMPGMSGEETFRKLREIDPEVTVVLSSGYNEIEATRRFTSKGLAGFLQKPYTADQLGEYVTQIITARRR
ncbi:MAG: response regulator [Byssovorax sp.]